MVKMGHFLSTSHVFEHFSVSKMVGKNGNKRHTMLVYILRRGIHTMLVSSDFTVVCCWRICVGSGGLSTGTAFSMKAGPGGSLSIVNLDGGAGEDCSVLAFFC